MPTSTGIPDRFVRALGGPTPIVGRKHCAPTERDARDIAFDGPEVRAYQHARSRQGLIWRHLRVHTAERQPRLGEDASSLADEFAQRDLRAERLLAALASGGWRGEWAEAERAIPGRAREQRERARAQCVASVVEASEQADGIALTVAGN